MPKKKKLLGLRPSFQGMHFDRVTREAAELAAAKHWQSYHDGTLSPGTLPHLLGDGMFPVIPTERDWEVAATVMQWLGSPVGRVYLEELKTEWVKIDLRHRRKR